MSFGFFFLVQHKETDPLERGCIAWLCQNARHEIQDAIAPLQQMRSPAKVVLQSNHHQIHLAHPNRPQAGLQPDDDSILRGLHGIETIAP